MLQTSCSQTPVQRRPLLLPIPPEPTRGRFNHGCARRRLQPYRPVKKYLPMSLLWLRTISLPAWMCFAELRIHIGGQSAQYRFNTAQHLTPQERTALLTVEIFSLSRRLYTLSAKAPQCNLLRLTGTTCQLFFSRKLRGDHTDYATPECHLRW